MDNHDQLAETHQLIKQLLAMDEQTRAESQKMREQLEKAPAGMSADTLSEKDKASLELKLKSADEDLKRRAEETREHERQFRERVIAELSRQTELLEQIAEALKS